MDLTGEVSDAVGSSVVSEAELSMDVNASVSTTSHWLRRLGRLEPSHADEGSTLNGSKKHLYVTDLSSHFADPAFAVSMQTV